MDIMPTPIDRALQSRNLFLGFAALVAGASLASMFGGDMFPAEKDPSGVPETWTEEELRRWLRRVRLDYYWYLNDEELMVLAARQCRARLEADTRRAH